MNKITLIKNEQQIPEKLEKNCIVMNGADKALTLNKVMPSIDTKPRTLDITDNGTYTVNASDKGFDAMTTVQVNVNVPGETYFDTFEGIQQVTSQPYDGSNVEVLQNALAQLRDFAEHCNCVGALLSVRENDDDGIITYTYTIWNGDPNNAEYYWDPRARDTENPEDYFNYGDPVAVCVGEGLWVIKGYFNNIWAPRDTDLYNKFIGPAVKGTGWENTKFIFENFAQVIDDGGCIWSDMYGNGTYKTGIPDWNSDRSQITRYGNVFIPSIMEQQKIQKTCVYIPQVVQSNSEYYFDTNIATFIQYNTDGAYWSSSQSQGNSSLAYRLGYNGSVSLNFKGYSSPCLVCVQF